MRPERVDELLAECGNSWLGGQKALVREAILKAVAEEAHAQHAKYVAATYCNCEICERSRRVLDAERLAL